MIGFAMLAASLVPPGRIDLASHTIRLHDVTAWHSTGTRGDAVIAQIPQDRSAFKISGRALAALVARTVPGARLTPANGEYLFVVQPLRPRGKQCWAAARTIAAQSTIDFSNVALVDCNGNNTDERFDVLEDGTSQNRKTITKDTKLGRLWLPREKRTEPGSVVRLVTKIGSVMIERDVIALQRGSAGQRVFARDQKGHVFAIAIGDETVR